VTDLFDYRLVHSMRYRKSPLFPIFRRMGATSFLWYNHLLHAVDFEGQTKEQEYEAIRHGVTLWDVSVERPVQIDGPDGHKLMQLLTPRDMDRCAVGQCKYTIITDENGCAVNDPVTLRLTENRYWMCPADGDVHLWAKGLAVGMGLDVTVSLMEVFPIQLQGPRSIDVLRSLIGGEIDALKYYYWMEARLPGGVPVYITRTGWTGELGYELYLLDNSRAEDMIGAILEHGKPFGLIPAGPNHARRIEAGIFNLQSDMDLSTNLYELGLEWQIEGDKDFIGKDALARIARDGIRRKLVGYTEDGPPTAHEFEGPWTVSTKDGRRIGTASAYVHSWTLGKNIGYAMVDIEHAVAGTEIVVQRLPDEPQHHAVVVDLPFIDKKKDIPKQAVGAVAS
jgi:aminomethyltransferase